MSYCREDSYRAGAYTGKRDGERGRHEKVLRRQGGGFVWRVDDVPEEYDPNQWADGYCDAFEAAEK